MTIFSLSSLMSCDTYAQTYMENDGIVYEYSYNSYPVRYINGIAYYYTYYNNLWRWIILPDMYRPYIIRHRPYLYSRPHVAYQHRNTYTNHPSMRPGGNMHHRPNNPGMHGRPGGNHGMYRGGSFGASSSRGRR